jgi:hypothetical protein
VKGATTAPTGSSWSRTAGLERLSAAFALAAERVGSVERVYSIAGLPVRVVAAGPKALDIVHRGLAHLATDHAGPADLLVEIWDTASSGIAVPELPPPEDATDPGNGDVRSAYHMVPRILSVYQRDERRAVVWVPDATRVPSNELASPLRTLLHWWSRDRGLQFVHGGAVSVEGRGVLLAGPSGTGKSTAAISCLLGGLDYLGDDYVLVDGGARPAVHSLFSAGKVQWSHIDAFPGLRPLIENKEELGVEKPLWFLERLFPTRMAASARAVAVLVPQVTGRRDTTIEPLRAAAALAALAPSTIVQLSGADQRSLSAIAAFLGRVPTYRLLSGTDLTGIARTVRAFLDEQPVASS